MIGWMIYICFTKLSGYLKNQKKLWISDIPNSEKTQV